MKPDDPADPTPPTAPATPPEPRPATNGTLLGHLILHSAVFHRPR
ncbi:hypothetical protein [Nocardia beijingensis]|nr:hypothetical protein [Nocardia beijingensis]